MRIMFKAWFIVAVFAVLFSNSLLVAQVPYGPSSPLGGGSTPQLTSSQAYLGSGTFELKLQGGLPFGIAYLGLSVARAQTTFNGIPIDLDYGQSSSISLVFLDGQGNGTFPLPLTGLTNPAFAGVRFYAQAYFVDPTASNGVAATQGLRVTFTLPPLVYVGSNTGQLGPGFLVDPATQTITNTINGVNVGVQGAVFTRDGQHLFVTGDIQNSITHADFTSGAPVWSTLQTFPGGGPILLTSGLALDEENDLLWSIHLQSISTATIDALDADPSSANFGAVVASFPVNNAGTVGFWGLNKTLRIGAVGLLFTPGVLLVDLDPASTTFGQVLANLTLPTSPGSFLPLATNFAFSRDGDTMYVAIQNAGGVPGELARYSFSQAAWIDHDPATPGIDNLGASSNPPLAIGPNPFSVSAPEYGVASDWVVLSGFGGPGGGWAARVDLGPAGGNAWTLTPATGPSFNEAWFSSVDPGGTMVAVAILQNGQGVLEFLDASTMAFTGSVPLPGSGGVSGSNLAPVTWR